MILKKQEIINLPVYTQSDDHLGKVVDFELSTDSHSIQKYIIKSGLIVGGILQHEMLISPDQVISITSEKMIVEDALINQEALKKAAITA